MPRNTNNKIFAKIHAAERIVAEWLEFLSGLDPTDERFSPSLLAYREAIELRNRLEQSLIAAD